MQTSTCTLIGVFNDYATAQRAADRLAESGFSRDEIHVHSSQDIAGESAHGNTGLTGRSPSDGSGGGIGGFFRRLFGSDTDEHEHGYYDEAISRGAAVVSVNTDDDNQDRAADILNEFGAIEVDERSASSHDRSRDVHDVSDRGERTIPVVDEELRVGKRPVQRGGVRIFNRVHDEPVEEQVKLREERVRVDRRRVDRPATEDDVRRHDEVIEVVEMAEEPVVEKRTRVVEEIVVGKEATERTETVRDSVRRSDVNVENVGASTDYDEDFRSDFKRRFSSDRSASYDTYAPAYQYGYQMASDQRYRGRRWEEIEPTLRSDYERNYPNSKWEQMKDSVRYGWDKVTGRR